MSGNRYSVYINHVHWRDSIAPVIEKYRNPRVSETLDLLKNIANTPNVMHSIMFASFIGVNNALAIGLNPQDDSIFISAEEVRDRMVKYVMRHSSDFSHDAMGILQSEITPLFIISAWFDSFEPKIIPQYNIFNSLNIMIGKKSQENIIKDIKTIRRNGYDIIPNIIGDSLWRSVEISYNPKIILPTIENDSLSDAVDMAYRIIEDELQGPQQNGPGM